MIQHISNSDTIFQLSVEFSLLLLSQNHRMKSTAFALMLLVGYPLNAKTNNHAIEPLNQKLYDAGLFFTENRGQVIDDKGVLRPDVLFTANGNGAKIFLTTTGIHYQFARTDFPKGCLSSEQSVKREDAQ